jgi:tetratricopeptide (TPR) repeat protein
VSLSLLRDLHESYLVSSGGAALRPEPWETALQWATYPLHATSSLLEPSEDGLFLAFDYLVDAAMRDTATPPVPEVVWTALVEQARPDDLVEVAWEASYVGHVDYVRRALDRATDEHQYVTAAALAECLSDAGLDAEAGERLERIIAQAAASGEVAAQDLLSMRRALAWGVGEKVGGHGDPQRALGVIRDVVRDSELCFGEDHPDSLNARLVLARQLGATGSASEALELATDIAAKSTRQLGPNHWLTLSARFEVAVWTRTMEGAREGVRLFRDLLEYLRSLDSEQPLLVIDTMWNLSGALRDDGDVASAIGLLESAVEESSAAYGPRHWNTLTVRLSYAEAVGQNGEPDKAVNLAAELADDCAYSLGPAHLTTLQARRVKAEWTARAGDRTSALEQYSSLHGDATRMFDENHWLTKEIRTQHGQLQNGCE